MEAIFNNKMMKLRIIASGSSGNCYLLEADEKETLVLEAGVKASTLKEAIDFDTDRVVGVLVSHRHGDHARYVPDYVRAGFFVYGHPSVFDKEHHRNKTIVPEQNFTVGNFRVMAFDVEHDTPCYGYLIQHPEMGVLVFATDTASINVGFNNVNHWLLEANYDNDSLQEAIQSGRTHGSSKWRLMGTHLSLENVIGVLLENNLSKTKTITLCHLSSRNSDEKKFVRKVQEHTGKEVYIATAGGVVELG